MRKAHRKLAPKRSRRFARRDPPKAIIVKESPPKPWLVSQDEVTLLKNAVCRGASDDELKYCLAVARRYELDPFQQQIWFVPRWDSQAQSTEGKTGAKVYIPVVGINGMLHIASRDHHDFGTYSEPEYGPMITVEWTNRGGKRQTFKAPEWARIECYKKGCPQPTVAKVWWEEIYPNVDHSPSVRQMPRLMLAKCAKAQATRTAYPKTGGLLIPEETHSREFTDITPGGRLITQAPANGEWGTKEAQQQVAERKIAEHVAQRPMLQSPKVEQRPEFVTVQPLSSIPGMLAVSGSGLSIVKAELSTIPYMVWLENAKTQAIPVGSLDEFIATCKKFGVDAVIKEQPKTVSVGPAEQRKAVSDRVASQPQTSGIGPQTPSSRSPERLAVDGRVDAAVGGGRQTEAVPSSTESSKPGPMAPPKAQLPWVTENVDPDKSKCQECSASFGVHLKTCSRFRAKEGGGQVLDDGRRVRGVIEMVYCRDSERKPLKTKTGSPFVKLVVGGITYRIFDNAERTVFIEGHEQKLRLFGLLAEAKPGDLVDFIYEEKSTDRGVLRNITNILRIGQFEWDESGVPVKQRSAQNKFW